MDATCAPPTWDGFWETAAVYYECAGGGVLIDFDTVSVVDTSPTISFSFIGGSQPGTTTGTISGVNFTSSYNIPGLCEEQYAFNGSFTNETTFVGTVTATFVDNSGFGIGCIDCTNQSFPLTGTR